jgi:hypothetical protein
LLLIKSSSLPSHSTVPVKVSSDDDDDDAADDYDDDDNDVLGKMTVA